MKDFYQACGNTFARLKGRRIYLYKGINKKKEISYCLRYKRAMPKDKDHPKAWVKTTDLHLTKEAAEATVLLLEREFENG